MPIGVCQCAVGTGANLPAVIVGRICAGQFSGIVQFHSDLSFLLRVEIYDRLRVVLLSIEVLGSFHSGQHPDRITPPINLRRGYFISAPISKQVAAPSLFDKFHPCFFLIILKQFRAFSTLRDIDALCFIHRYIGILFRNPCSRCKIRNGIAALKNYSPVQINNRCRKHYKSYEERNP